MIIFPTAKLQPLGRDSYTKVLLHCNGGVFASSSDRKFGIKSCLFDNPEGAIQLVGSGSMADYDISGGVFTFDFWMKKTANPAANSSILSKASRFTPYTGWIIGLTTSGNIYFAVNRAETNVTNGTIPNSKWTHVAIVKISLGGTYQIYIDGVMQTLSNTDASCPNTTDDWIFGNYDYWVGVDQYRMPYAGLMDEFRFSKGIARWTLNFTPPKGPYY